MLFKKFAGLFLILLLILSCSSSSKIEFKELSYDFGRVKQNSVLEHVFVFKNIGSSTLTIDQIKPSCGCTGVLLSSKDIPAGGEGNIKATLTIGASSGKLNKSIYVYTNDKNNQILKLKLEALVVK